MTKINYGAILSATIVVDNSNETGRTYDIQANVRVSSTSVGSIESGVVKKDGQQVADFSSYQEGYLGINFQNEEDRASVLSAVDDFLSSARAMSIGEIEAYGIGKEDTL